MWLTFNDAQHRIGLTKYKYFFSPLSLRRIGFLVKIIGVFVIRALCSDHVISTFRCKKMPEYKSIFIHIHYWPTDAKKRYTQKSFARASAVRFLALSVFFSHNGARIQIDFCNAHMQTVTRDVAWWLHTVMWRFR